MVCGGLCVNVCAGKADAKGNVCAGTGEVSTAGVCTCQ